MTKTNLKSFEFNLQSNGRLNEMMKFEIKDTRFGHVLYDKSHDYLAAFGNIYLRKENNKMVSYCFKQNNQRFDYKGIDNALCGKTRTDNNRVWEGEFFTPKRIIVIQMN